ncbi:uncharacterized protein LOC141695323 [Apium graveolens]|uniref:uncharacterized protein LOC141695323 n=1 Tax=Apium graveolens TaxID=4045 RepID=UPI003D7B709C
MVPGHYSCSEISPKIGFVDKTINKPIEKRKQLDWDTVISMIVSRILRTMDLKVVSSIPYHDEAKKLWLYLEKRSAIANGPRIQQLRAAITESKQEKEMSIEDYYNKLYGLWDELNRLKTLHICECGTCTCDVQGKFATDHEDENGYTNF